MTILITYTDGSEDCFSCYTYKVRDGCYWFYGENGYVISSVPLNNVKRMRVV